VKVPSYLRINKQLTVQGPTYARRYSYEIVHNRYSYEVGILSEKYGSSCTCTVHVIFIFNLVIFGFNVGKIRISSANQNTAFKLKSNYGTLTPLYLTLQ
jgi:hypothetical protein